MPVVEEDIKIKEDSSQAIDAPTTTSSMAQGQFPLGNFISDSNDSDSECSSRPTRDDFILPGVEMIEVNLANLQKGNLMYCLLGLPNGQLLTALVDTGANHSLISQRTIDRLGLVAEKSVPVEIQGINNIKAYCSGIYSIEVEARNSTRIVKIISVPSLPTKFQPPPSQFVYPSNFSQRQVDLLRAAEKLVNKEIDLLLGSELCWDLIENSSIKLLTSGFKVVETELGLMISNSAREVKSLDNVLKSLITLLSPVDAEDKASSRETLDANSIDHVLVEQLWELDRVGLLPILDENLTDQQVIEEFRRAVKLENGRISVAIPLNGKEARLADNKAMATRRLESLYNRLKNTPRLEEYNQIIQTQLDSGIVEPAQDIPEGKPYHIPHRAVIKNDSATTKTRIVYDASSKQRGCLSLNDCAFSGPSILQSIVGILLRARSRKFIMVADVEKAFHMVSLQEQCRDLTRFLWLKDIGKPPSSDNIRTLRFARVPFGLTSSPFLLAMAITWFLERNDNEINEEIRKNLYVDNVILTSDDEGKLLEMYQASKAIFDKMLMNLRDYQSNHLPTISQIHVGDRAKPGPMKLLGLQWDSTTDQLAIKIPLSELDHPTKRQLVAYAASRYDPLGLVSPTLTRAKTLIQDVWKQDCKWDEKIPADLLQDWRYIVETEVEREFVIPRCPISSRPHRIVIFSDASQRHYGACAYALGKVGSEHESGIILAKGRICPPEPKTITIPRLELMGIGAGVRMAETIVAELNVLPSEIIFLSDSSIAIWWIKSEKPLRAFVHNQVQAIKSGIEGLVSKGVSARILHCPGTENPADLITRGLPTSELKSNNLWLYGPDFLRNDPETWGSQIVESEFMLSEVEKEFRVTVNAFQARQVLDGVKSEPRPIIPFERVRSFKILAGATALILRFFARYKSRYLARKNEKISASSILFKYSPDFSETEALEEAKKYLIRQHIVELDEENSLKIKPTTVTYLDEDALIRVEKRLDNSELADPSTFPYYIAENHILSDLILHDLHIDAGHQKNATIAGANLKYWIPRVGVKVSSLVNRCVKCRKVNAWPFKYPAIPPLPESRVVRSTPFSHLGIDYFGPIYFRNEQGEKTKIWVLLATCMVTRAIHLDLVNNNSAHAFILAFRRMISIRGTPEQIVLDNAPAFTLGMEIIQADLENFAEDQEVQHFLAHENIEVRHIVPLSPWRGGLYERMVGVVKSILRKLDPLEILTKPELDTLIREVEAIVNSRPITAISNDPANFQAIRPVDFLLPGVQLTIPIEIDKDSRFDASKVEKITRAHLHRINHSLELVWKSWQRDYLTQLRISCNKNKRYSKGIPSVGQVVLITDSTPRNTWPMGVITSVEKSSDGEIRSANVKMRTGTFRRSTNQLIPLEICASDPENLGKNPNKPRVQPRRACKEGVNYADQQ